MAEVLDVVVRARGRDRRKDEVVGGGGADADAGAGGALPTARVGPPPLVGAEGRAPEPAHGLGPGGCLRVTPRDVRATSFPHVAHVPRGWTPSRWELVARVGLLGCEADGEDGAEEEDKAEEREEASLTSCGDDGVEWDDDEAPAADRRRVLRRRVVGSWAGSGSSVGLVGLPGSLPGPGAGTRMRIARQKAG